MSKIKDWLEEVRSLSRRINNFITRLFLLSLYYTLFGLIAIVYKFFRRKDEYKTSYWKDASIKDFDINSPY